MYKVFFNDRIVFLTNNIERDLNNSFGAIFKYSNKKELKDFINHFESKKDIKSAFVYHHDLEELLELFSECFKVIHAAGGVVKNNQNEILVIHRLGVWDLPKGKAEKGESIEQTALREVEEECGIAPLKIVKALSPTYHTYWLKSKLILKKTFWYEMQFEGDKTPIPQLEEDIQIAEWRDLNDVDTIYQNTYPSIIEVLNEVIK